MCYCVPWKRKVLEQMLSRCLPPVTMSRVRYCAVASHNTRHTFPLLHGLINANCYSYLMDFHFFLSFYSLTTLCMCVLTVPPLHSSALPLNSFPLGPLLPSCLGFLSRVYMCVSEGMSENKLELLASWMEELFAEPWTVYSLAAPMKKMIPTHPQPLISSSSPGRGKAVGLMRASPSMMEHSHCISYVAQFRLGPLTWRTTSSPLSALSSSS